MSNLEIISFKKQKLISNKHVIYFFYSYFVKHLDDIFTQFRTHANRKEIIVYVCNIIFNVFWIVYDSTQNIFMSLFLSDKSVLLFTQFIIISTHSGIIENVMYKPTIQDAVNFSYKKTIDTIRVGSLFKRPTTYDIIRTCFFFKEIIKLIYTNPESFNTRKDKLIEIINKKDYTFESKGGWLFYTNLVESM
jgi:hypothetical protein